MYSGRHKEMCSWQILVIILDYYAWYLTKYIILCHTFFAKYVIENIWNESLWCIYSGDLNHYQWMHWQFFPSPYKDSDKCK
jgi:hypothetical protein